jgi:bacterioferritin-associated ferredoxin
MSGQLMMTKFKDFSTGANQGTLENPSVKVSLKASAHTLYLKFDSKDNLLQATYEGHADPWMSALCSVAINKNLNDLSHLCFKDFDQAFADDQSYWDFKVEKAEQFFFSSIELLKAGLDIYRGREYLYKEPEALICRCFGVRENDVLAYVRSTDDPTPEGLATASKAGMGCRSCVPQLTKWLSIHTPNTTSRHYKEKTRAHWLLEIDYMLSCFPEAGDWKMEVKSFQGNQVMITYDKKVSQVEEEKVTNELQDFLAAGLDADLSFFLIRA